ncbi:MAG: efflux RND transporter periplasmic adaptor subunit [bacterium]|nr:efflux RND transporter periplasmic adaptor subunit [bacterium]
MIEITVSADGQAPEKHRFEGAEVRIGRDADNDLVLLSTGCSRHHAKIVRQGSTYQIIDLGSTNGLLVGSQVVRELPLADGMSLVIGASQLTFGLAEQAVPEDTVRMFYGSPSALAPEPAPPPLGPEPLYLVFGSGRDERALKIAPGAEYVLGRSPSADLVLADGECSKRHAQVHARGGQFHVVDLESSNGTLVNGERIRDAPLSVGDEIVIGQTSVRVQDQIHDVSDRGNLLEHTIRAMPAWRDGIDPGLEADRGHTGRGLRPRRPMLAVLFIGAVLITAVTAYLLGRRPGARPDSPSEPARQETSVAALVQVAPVRLQELIFDLTSSGSVEARHSVTVSAEVAARVEGMPIAQGTTVEQGTPLLRLGDRDIRHQIEAARASISRERVLLAKEDYERKERLFQDGAVVRSVVEQAKNQFLTLDSAYRSTQAKISQLEAQLAKTRIAAPISGTVTRIFVEGGEFVGPGTPVATLEDMEEVVVRLQLADRDFIKVRAGQPVEATAAAFPEEVFRGSVTTLGSAADPVTRTFEVEARLDNIGLRLRPGLIVSLRIILDRERGLMVPAEAISIADEDRGSVFVAVDGRARRKEVRLGRRLDRNVEVLAGLAEGEDLIVVGQDALFDGQAIEPYREPSQ